MTKNPEDRRRYPRRATRQPVQLVFAGMALPCEIRDFCQAGLQLVFPADDLGHTVLPLERGASLAIEFEVGAGAEARHFVVQGKAAHITSSSIGVFLEAISDEALQALAQGAGEVVPSEELAGVDLGAGKKRALRQECTRLLSAFLDRVMLDFFAWAPGRLREAGLEVGSLSQSRYLLGAIELEQHRGSIQDAFFSAVRECVQGKAPSDGASPPAEGLTVDDMELVDVGKFEDWLNMSAVINRLEVELDQALAYFEKRYALIVDQPVERKNNPFGPEVICHALHGALENLDFTNPMRTVLYQVLGQVLQQHFPDLYDRLGKVLALIHPAPADRKVIRRAAPASPEGGGGEAGARLGQDAGGEYNLDRILASIGRLPSAGSDPTGEAAAAGRADVSLARLIEAMRQSGQHLASARAPGAQAGQEDHPQASLGELLAALESLSMGQLTVPGGQVKELPELLSAHLARAGGEARGIAPSYREALDIAARLYERARSEQDAASEVESLLRRLERPLLKLALQDPNFLASADHPARAVVNLIDQFAIAANDAGRFFDPKLTRFLSLLVDRVCSQSEQDPEVFPQVADRLAKALEPMRQARRNRVHRLQEVSEARDALRGARARVAAFLAGRYAGREVSALLPRLLDAGWRQYLVLREIRRAADPGGWDQAVSLLDRFESCLLPNPDADINPHRLIDEMSTCLASVNIERAEVDALARDIARHVAAPANVPVTRVVVLPGEPSPPPGANDGARQQDRVGVLQLAVGDWWAFAEGERWVRKQLIWLSRDGGACVFTNRSATDKLELSRAELAQRLEQESLRPDPGQALPLLERSENVMFDEAFRKLVDQALHDPVTGQRNRNGFIRRLREVTAGPHSQAEQCLCLVEFDQIRVVYSSSGTDAGDKLLRKLAAQIQSLAPAGATLGAMGNDAFLLFLPESDLNAGQESMQKLLDALKDYRFQHQRHVYSIGLNIGITEFRPALSDLEEVLRQADSACLTAKSKGRNRMQTYQASDLQLQAQESFQDWASRIDGILERDGLFLRCQMVIPLAPDAAALPYYEVLLGIRDLERGDVQPMQFIPAVERWKRSHEIDLWVLHQVFVWIRANRARFDQFGGFAVNLSAMSLDNPEVLAYLHAELGRKDLPAERITFEVTETAAIDSYNAAQDFIRQVRAYGCRFALDDFGSGFASYAHLKNLRTDTLKIDGSFVKEIGHSEVDFAMVKSMNDIGHSLGMKTVAEYVESDLILSKLRQIGVDYGQGYAIHRPVAIDDLLKR